MAEGIQQNVESVVPKVTDVGTATTGPRGL